MKKHIFYFGIGLLFLSCGSETPEAVTNPADYDRYLVATENPTKAEAENEVRFWSDRLRPDSSGVGDLGPLAAAYTRMFEATGTMAYLKNSETLYLKGRKISANNKDIYERSLAHNYISQHRFKEAATLLQDTYQDPGSRKRPTELMIFDVMMELGRYDEAEEYLQKIQNSADYNYLIRKAKWSDHTGNLDEAINYMEDAVAIAESRNSKGLKIWTYSNLADFYGHAGRIGDAYTYYLKTLELQPDNAYVKKGIAWIVYAHEHNTTEARRIINTIRKQHQVPDYYLFLAELAAYEGNEKEAAVQTANFVDAVQSGDYGDMYNTYLIEILSQSSPEEAVRLAETEVANRATPETYQLLAYANLKAGNKERALEIVKNEVEAKTFEPMALYHSALVYQANGENSKVKRIKKELAEAAFELGPVLMKEIHAL
jgi:tetratricopeptide (TPR) repeat protein